MQRRSRYEVTCDILQCCTKPKLRTHILYECNLSGGQLRSYLSSLVRKGMLETMKKHKKKHYVITGKGFAFTEKFSELKKVERVDPSDVPLILAVMNERKLVVMNKSDALREIERSKQ